MPTSPRERRNDSYISEHQRQRRRRRDDTTFKAPCMELPNVWDAPQQPKRCGARLGNTPSCQPIPGHFVTANRETSSKPPRFIRHRRRFGDFQNLGFGGVFAYFLPLLAKSMSPKASQYKKRRTSLSERPSLFIHFSSCARIPRRAMARWLTAFFSAGVSCAAVQPYCGR